MLAAAAYHVERDHQRTARRLLGRAAERLNGLPAGAAGVLPADLEGRIAATLSKPLLALPPVTL
jgi:predicted metal-dependent hydrolase